MNAYFGSRWSPSSSEMVRAVRSAYEREVIDTVPVCDDETVDAALRGLAKGKAVLDDLPSEALAAVFSKTAGLMRQRSGDLARLISREQGKVLREATDEVGVAASLIESFAKDAYRLGRQFQPLALEARVGDRFGFTRQRPMGVEAILTPNTFPLLIPVKLVIPALAAGNVVALKPASATPFSALKMVELFLEGGLPPEAMACLTGPGSQTGQAICRHPLVDQVCCYGGMETIRAVRSSIGLIPLQFHHGGMTVCALAADADLELAVRSLLEQGFENAGQTAISVGVVYADTAIYDEFVERLAVAMRTLVAGNPLVPGTKVGPLAEEARAWRASRLVKELVESGGRIVSGTGEAQGSLMAPVLVADIAPEHPSLFPVNASRELLSPVMGVIRVQGDMEQISPWLDRRTQPAVCLFTRDLEQGAQAARAMPVFNVHINGIPTWRDGIIFTSQSSSRLGRRQSEKRVMDMSTQQDIVFYPS